MTALQKSGFYWFCTNCRTDSRPSQRKIFSNSSSQTSPMSSPPIFNNHSPAPALPLPTFSPVATKRLQSITSIAKPPSFNNLHRSCTPPLLPPKSDKIAWKRINNPPILHLLTFLSVNYQLILYQSLIHLPLPTITHLTTHLPFL